MTDTHHTQLMLSVPIVQTHTHTRTCAQELDDPSRPFLPSTLPPHTGMQSTFKEYQEWCDEEVSEESLPTYTLAAKKLKELEQFERNLVS